MKLRAVRVFVVLTVLSLFGLSSHSTEDTVFAALSHETFTGHWVNVGPTSGITRVHIVRPSASSSEELQTDLRVRLWGSCHPSDCDWGWMGARLNTTSGTYVSVFRINYFSYRDITITRSGDVLTLRVRTTYTDNRSPRDDTYQFRRTSSPLPGGPSLWSAAGCSNILNIEGSGPVICEHAGGRNFGKAGETFISGRPQRDRIFILLRFRDLPVGRHEVRAEAYRMAPFTNVWTRESRHDESFRFNNTSSSWAAWIRTNTHQKAGYWTFRVILDNKSVGPVERYCVDCILE